LPVPRAILVGMKEQSSHSLFRRRQIRLEPALAVALRDDDWHSVMHRFDDFVRIGCNHRRGEQLATACFPSKDTSIGLRTLMRKLKRSPPLPHSGAGGCFHEWQKLDAKNKQLVAIATKDVQPYALAGFGSATPS
jgi:hypothetical protein